MKRAQLPSPYPLTHAWKIDAALESTYADVGLEHPAGPDVYAAEHARASRDITGMEGALASGSRVSEKRATTTRAATKTAATRTV